MTNYITTSSQKYSSLTQNQHQPANSTFLSKKSAPAASTSQPNTVYISLKIHTHYKCHLERLNSFKFIRQLNWLLRNWCAHCNHCFYLDALFFQMPMTNGCGTGTQKEKKRSVKKKERNGCEDKNSTGKNKSLQAINSCSHFLQTSVLIGTD